MKLMYGCSILCSKPVKVAISSATRSWKTVTSSSASIWVSWLVGLGRGRGRGRGRGDGRGRGRAGAAQGQAGPLGPPDVPGPSRLRARSARGAAAEANRTLDESVDRGEVTEESFREKTGKEKQKEKEKEKRKERQKEKQKENSNKAYRAVRRKKRKLLRTRRVKKELVYVRDCAAFLEFVREERGIPAEEAMVRLAIDAGQGSLKVVANLFNRYYPHAKEVPCPSCLYMDNL